MPGERRAHEISAAPSGGPALARGAATAQNLSERRRRSHAGGSGEQDPDPGGQRCKVLWAAAQSRRLQVHGPPQGGQAAKESGRPRGPPRQAVREGVDRAGAGGVQHRADGPLHPGL